MSTLVYEPLPLSIFVSVFVLVLVVLFLGTKLYFYLDSNTSKYRSISHLPWCFKMIERTLHYRNVLCYTIQYNIFYLNTVKVKDYAAYRAVLQC